MPLFQGGNEDYLFLDLHVPAKALEKGAAKSSRFGLDLWGGGVYVWLQRRPSADILPFCKPVRVW